MTDVVHNIETKVAELSISFDDYHPEARAEHEGKSLFVGVHVPREFAKHLTLSSTVTITITEPQSPALPDRQSPVLDATKSGGMVQRYSPAPRAGGES